MFSPVATASTLRIGDGQLRHGSPGAKPVHESKQHMPFEMPSATTLCGEHGRFHSTKKKRNAAPLSPP